jgi:hypothetical protein
VIATAIAPTISPIAPQASQFTPISAAYFPYSISLLVWPVLAVAV